MASDRDICLALLGFMVPQLFLLWYLLPVAETQTVSLDPELFPPLVVLELRLGTVTVILQEAFLPLPSFAVQVIVAIPFPLATTLPVLETVATVVLLLFQVTAVEVAFAGATVAFS